MNHQAIKPREGAPEQLAAEDRAADAALAQELSIGEHEGAEFLSDQCIMKGCIFHYGHDGQHEY